MRFLTMLALVPFFALSYQSPAQAGAEDAESLPWDGYVRESVTPPEAAVKLLTTLRLGSRMDTLHIPLVSCGANLQAVELKVTGANVTVQSFGLRFTDGNTREFAVNKTFNAGTDSGWIDLGLFKAMDQRCPVDVYAKAQASGNATVLVYGNMK